MNISRSELVLINHTNALTEMIYVYMYLLLEGHRKSLIFFTKYNLTQFIFKVG